jgi:hypothetical protein
LLRFETDYVNEALRASDGNIAAAARLAKIDRKHFWRLMQRTGGGGGRLSAPNPVVSRATGRDSAATSQSVTSSGPVVRRRWGSAIQQQKETVLRAAAILQSSPGPRHRRECDGADNRRSHSIE